MLNVSDCYIEVPCRNNKRDLIERSGTCVRTSSLALYTLLNVTSTIYTGDVLVVVLRMLLFRALTSQLVIET